jgi:hypothetical protein
MTIEPDTKDWTWVLQRPCPECGLDARGIDRDQIGAMVRANAASWQSLLTAPGDPGRRPSPATSATSCGCTRSG